MAAPQQPGGLEALSSMLPIILVTGVAMWFFSIRPSMKRQKEHDELLKNLKTGDRVQTQAGMIGEVAQVKDKTVFLKLGDGVRVEFQKQAITGVLKDD
jgi:preprotein translocase subunit YajC